MEGSVELIVPRLTDDAIFDYPFLFMSDVGWQRSSTTPERQQLERYLAAGGFLWADDFWGDAEWENFRRNTDLRPAWKWQAIPPSHTIMNIVYDLKVCPQIPARLLL